MAELLKVTTPLVKQNQAVAPKQGTEPVNPFSLQTTTRVLQPHNQSGVRGQNTGLLEGREGATILMDLLKDPSVTASYLKNIFLLEEVFKLLPANNQTVTGALEQLFGGLLAQPGDVAAELIRQGEDATSFRGPFFDFLRALNGSAEGGEVPRAVANLLKAMNHVQGRRDILDAVANNLGYLAKALAPSKDLSGRLGDLALRFRQAGAQGDFEALKQEALALFREVEESILYSPKLGKNVSIAVYNLSRYNDNADYLTEAASYLRRQLPPEQRQQLARFLADFRSGFQERVGPGSSRVMDTLAELLGLQAGRGDLSSGDDAKLDGILHSLLSSPCNFTPLLHFVVPTLFENVRAFAEVWVNPDGGEGEMPEGAGGGRHLLLVVDVDGVGRFEAELFVYRRTVDLLVYAPPGREGLLSGLRKSLPGRLAQTDYRLGRVSVETLERPRSLMDVFKSLPYKRVGVDVKI